MFSLVGWQLFPGRHVATIFAEGIAHGVVRFMIAKSCIDVKNTDSIVVEQFDLPSSSSFKTWSVVLPIALINEVGLVRVNIRLFSLV